MQSMLDLCTCTELRDPQIRMLSIADVEARWLVH